MTIVVFARWSRYLCKYCEGFNFKSAKNGKDNIESIPLREVMSGASVLKMHNKDVNIFCAPKILI